MNRKRILTILGVLVVVGVVVFAAIQLIRPDNLNSKPPITSPAPWPDPRAEEIARLSCYECHSNETKWYWYMQIAPSSWLTARDVKRGRLVMNFSEWDPARAPSSGQLEYMVNNGKMPLPLFLITHPGARLNDEQKKILIDAYKAMVQR
jgi:hypothetical protein